MALLARTDRLLPRFGYVVIDDRGSLVEWSPDMVGARNAVLEIAGVKLKPTYLVATINADPSPPSGHAFVIPSSQALANILFEHSEDPAFAIICDSEGVLAATLQQQFLCLNP